MTVSKSTIIENTWKEFYDRVKAQVTTTTITGSVVVNVQNYVSSFPDNEIDSKSAYPIIVINSPKFSGEVFTIGKDKLDGIIEIEVYTTQAEAADKLFSQVIDSIETYKHSFREAGLTMVKLDDTDSDHISRDKINIHTRMAQFKFSFQYVKTGAY